MNKTIDYSLAAVLKLYTGIDYDDFDFDDKYFDELLSHMGVDVSKLDWDAFLSGHFNLLLSYLQARKEEDDWVSIDTENKALAKVQSLANNLADALDKLETIGQAGKRLYSEILANKKGAFKHENTMAADLLGHPDHKRFDGITDLLFDISVGLERAKICKPKKLSPPKFEGDLRKWEKQKADHIMKVVAVIGTNDNAEERFQTSVQEQALPANFALLAFVWNFEELWHKFTTLQFTEGRHEPDAGQTISRAVDAAEHCLRKYGATVRRSLIERKVREVREAKYEVMS